jgi:4-diphosphocytidyl-2-C-methyl-D-erythritol kinase
MLAFPNAKINLGLDILRKRPDGYHELETCLYPIPWHDVLEILPADSFSFNQTGLQVPGNPDDNLCVVAYQLLKEEYNLPPVEIHLHKVVPMGAGLGGGSADGAFTIKLLNAIFELQLSLEQQKSYAAKLGSDCPFFIENIPAIATGTGTELSPIDLDLSSLYIGIIKPDVHVSTARAYSGVSPGSKERKLQESLTLSIDQWQKLIHNDFEDSIFEEFSLIRQTKARIQKDGAVYAAMSGSGSSVFGLFTSEIESKSDYNLFKKLSLNT